MLTALVSSTAELGAANPETLRGLYVALVADGLRGGPATSTGNLDGLEAGLAWAGMAPVEAAMVTAK
jgi:hypothetical protein